MANRRQKGTGSVWQDDNKVWHGQIQVGYLSNGNKKMKSVTGKTAKEVKYKLEQIKATVITGTYVDTSNITIPKLANLINDEKKNLNLIKIGSYNRNRQTIKIIENTLLNNIPIQKVTETILMEFYLNITNYSNSVLKKVYEQINACMKKAIKLNIITYNINEDIPRPQSTKTTKKVSALNVEQQKKFIDAINTDNKEPYRTMLLISLLTGMRMGEICALSVNNVSSTFGTININRTITRDENERFVLGDTTKTISGARTIKVTPFVIQLIENYKEKHWVENENNLLFTIKGQLIGTNQINSYYKRLIVRYGISKTDKGFNQHQLRHTYATRCIESGMSAKVLQTKMGHKDIKVTMNTYADVFAMFEDTEDLKYTQYLQSQGLLG